MPVTEKRGDITIVLAPLTVFTYDWILHPSHACAYMDEVVNMPNGVKSESASLLAESSNDIFIPYSEDGDIIDYLKEQSRNFKMFSKNFELETDNVTLSEDFKFIYSKQSNGDTFAIKTEDALQQEFNQYAKKIFTNKFI